MLQEEGQTGCVCQIIKPEPPVAHGDKVSEHVIEKVTKQREKVMFKLMACHRTAGEILDTTYSPELSLKNEQVSKKAKVLKSIFLRY